MKNTGRNIKWTCHRNYSTGGGEDALLLGLTIRMLIHPVLKNGPAIMESQKSHNGW